jgi:AcrR family transcriptional regulator
MLVNDHGRRGLNALAAGPGNGGHMPKVSEGYREARREEIIAAALRAFATKGFSRASMADIIAESGLSVGAIYGHFSGKRELLAACATDVLNRRRDEIGAAIDQGQPPTPGEAIALLVRGMVREGIDSRALVQLWAEATVDPELRGIANNALSIIREALQRALRAWFAAHPEQAPQGIDEAVRSLVPVLAGLGQGYILQRTIVDDFDEEAYLASVRDLLPH